MFAIASRGAFEKTVAGTLSQTSPHVREEVPTWASCGCLECCTARPVKLPASLARRPAGNLFPTTPRSREHGDCQRRRWYVPQETCFPRRPARGLDSGKAFFGGNLAGSGPPRSAAHAGTPHTLDLASLCPARRLRCAGRAAPFSLGGRSGPERRSPCKGKWSAGTAVPGGFGTTLLLIV
jgi:hypothetical protein